MTDEELKNKCTERAKIFQQTMESCHSSSPIDCIEWFADRIAELTEQNTSLLTSVENLNKSVQELEKKNVELKTDNSEWEKASDKWKNLYYSTNEQLTEAEVIIKDLMRTSRDCIRWYLLCDKANKFIREIKDNDKRRDEK